MKRQESPKLAKKRIKRKKRTSGSPKGSQAPSPEPQLRIYTFKNLKFTINDIFLSKQRYDKKCMESGVPRETLEQYLFTYLNQKYGLKSLIVEHSVAIVNSLTLYMREDNEIRLFSKILKCECDEEYRPTLL